MSDSAHHPGMTRRSFVRAGLGALAAPLFVGCGSSPSEVEVSGPRLTARPGSQSTTPVLGLTDLGLGDPRDGILYVPESYTGLSPMPLLVALHGAGGNGRWWVPYTATAEARGMVLLAPDSRATTWDVVQGSLSADVGFIDRALAHTFERVRIDPTRIALGGFSDGASYALSLGVSNGDLFSHLVAYSPGFYWSSPPIVGSPPVYVSHGTQDPVLPVTGTRDLIVPGLQLEGYDVTYEEFEGGHTIPAEIAERSLNWFLGAPGGA